MSTQQRVPEVTFKCRVRDESIGGDNPYRWEDKTTADIFGGKKALENAKGGEKSKIKKRLSREITEIFYGRNLDA